MGGGALVVLSMGDQKTMVISVPNGLWAVPWAPFGCLWGPEGVVDVAEPFKYLAKDETMIFHEMAQF